MTANPSPHTLGRLASLAYVGGSIPPSIHPPPHPSVTIASRWLSSTAWWLLKGSFSALHSSLARQVGVQHRPTLSAHHAGHPPRRWLWAGSARKSWHGVCSRCRCRLQPALSWFLAALVHAAPSQACLPASFSFESVSH